MNRLLFLLLFCTNSFTNFSQSLQELMHDYPTEDIDEQSYARCWIPTEYKDSIFLENIIPLYPNKHLLNEIGDHDTLISVVPILPERDTVFIEHPKPLVPWKTKILTVEAKRKPIILSDKYYNGYFETSKSLEEYYQRPFLIDTVNIGDTIFQYAGIDYYAISLSSHVLSDITCLSAPPNQCIQYFLPE